MSRCIKSFYSFFADNLLHGLIWLHVIEPNSFTPNPEKQQINQAHKRGQRIRYSHCWWPSRLSILVLMTTKTRSTPTLFKQHRLGNGGCLQQASWSPPRIAVGALIYFSRTYKGIMATSRALFALKAMFQFTLYAWSWDL